MALDQAQPEQGPTRISDDEEQDLRVAVNLAKELIDDGGIDVIDQAIEQSNDPGQVVGQFMMQLASQMGEELPADQPLSPNIWFAVGGWVEQISDYLQEQYDIPKDVMDRAEVYIGTAAQEMANGQQNAPQAPSNPQAAQPVLPGGGVV